ncbi:MAG: YggS family pyridoxal phosphate-dependent enzyme [Ignavibacteria bacterium]|jgi:pyridoxal phosphate enzyme (YggS family)|nr:YggS family pyridoxal phosphate-dependent enzyme [Ignavibacteria bacterium]
MENIYKENYENIQNKIIRAANAVGRNPDDIKILAVSKTHNYEVIANAISAGIPVFAENYAQEFRDKNKELTEYYVNNNLNIPLFEWHFIGHLQENKVKYIIPYVTTIHTIDSIGLATEINKQSEKYNKKVNVLLQINTSGEESKSGVEPETANTLTKQMLALPNLNLIGLMTIGTFSEDAKIIRKEFTLLRNTLKDVNDVCGIDLKELSMGMSHDFEIAISEQATMVRIGTAIFGERYYPPK